MLLLIGVAVLFVLLNNAAASPSPLPTVPAYNPIFSLNTPIPTKSPIPTNTLLPNILTPTVTGTPNFTLAWTPIFVTPTNSYQSGTSGTYYYAPTSTSRPLSVYVWTYTPVPSKSTPSSSGSQGQTCKNILYPMTAGRQWVYQATTTNRSDVLSMNVLSVGNSQGNVQITNQTTGSTKQVQVQCAGDVIRNFPFMSVDALLGTTLNSSISASYISGVLAPNESAFLNNNWALGWSSQYMVTGTSSINRGGAQLSVTLNNSPLSLNCQTLATGDAAFETVTVAAGTFRALKVVCSEQAQVTTYLNGATVTGTAEGRSYQWFAPYVGLVKMKVDYAVVKLFDVSFSLLTDNNLELRSYITTP